MKILLLNPPFKTEYGRYSRSSRSPAITKSGTLYYPLWLAYVAGVVEDAGYEVMLLDSCAEEYDRKKTYEIAQQFQPDLIVLDTSTPSIYNDVEIGGELKDIFPQSFIVLMGTHPTALPEETLKLSSKIDAVVVGEAEFTILELANALNAKKASPITKETLSSIRGISFNSGDGINSNPKRPRIESLDELPFLSKVYKKHLNYRNYFFSAAEYPMIMLITGRGCPAHCHFCVYPQTMHSHKYICRSIENIIEEIKYIKTEFPDVKSIGFEDDTFTFNKKRTQMFCEKMIEAGLHDSFNWWVNARVNTLDLETMKLMKKAGCRLLIPGFESSNQQILNNMRKGTKVDDAFEFMKNAKKAGLLVHGCFMVGNPGETRQTMEATLGLACELNPDTAQFFPMIPYPGTEAFEWALKNNYLKFNSYADWLTEDGLHNTILNPEELSSEDLVNFCNYARRRFYLRPSYIFKKALQSVSSMSELKRNLKAFRSLCYYLMKKD